MPAAVVSGDLASPPKPVVALLRHLPQAPVIPGYLIGVGLRPEHEPVFARRPCGRPKLRSQPLT